MDAKIITSDQAVKRLKTALEEWLAKRKSELEMKEREEKMQIEIKLHEKRLKLHDQY